jgi:hypothetical protein
MEKSDICRAGILKYFLPRPTRSRSALFWILETVELLEAIVCNEMIIGDGVDSDIVVLQISTVGFYI